MSSAGLAVSETKTKVRLKFRVSCFEGGKGRPSSDTKWSEKWGVGLFDYEEFHVTDQLLKLPFQEHPAKTVCIFSLAGHELRFRMLDGDRTARINTVEKNDTIVRMGDKIAISDTIVIEVLLAPETDKKGEPRVSSSDAPPIGDDGPTLTLTSTSESTEVPIPGPVFGQQGKSLEIEEGTSDEIKAEKRNSLWVTDPSISLERLNRPARPEVDRPNTIKTPKLDANRLSIAERILAAVARVLKRDDLEPPAEQFPLDDFNPDAASPRVPKPKPPSPSSAQPWIAPEPKIELDMRHMQRAAVAAAQSAEAQPWMPEAESPGARFRGRALVFMLSAGITLVLMGGGYHYIEQWMNHRESEKSLEAVANISQNSFDRGVPVEIIEDKVRRMKRRPIH